MTTPESLTALADRDVKVIADAIGDVVIPGSATLKARFVISKELIALMAAASLRARAADMQARAVGAPHPSPEQKGSEQ